MTTQNLHEELQFDYFSQNYYQFQEDFYQFSNLPQPGHSFQTFQDQKFGQEGPLLPLYRQPSRPSKPTLHLPLSRPNRRYKAISSQTKSGSLLYGAGHLLESSQFFLALSQGNNIEDLGQLYCI